MSQTSDVQPSVVFQPVDEHRTESGKDVARARFLEGRDGNLRAVEVDVPESWNIGEELDRALFFLRIQVVVRKERRNAGRIAYWLRVAEFDGAPIRESRRRYLQAELLMLLGPGAYVEPLHAAPISRVRSRRPQPAEDPGTP